MAGCQPALTALPNSRQGNRSKPRSGFRRRLAQSEAKAKAADTAAGD
jgi:hypothetical protein